MPLTRVKHFPLEDEIGFVELLYSMGNDLSVVNDARASYDKESFTWGKKGEKLLKYLIKHEHWSPFRGVVFKFRVKTPLYVCRQWWKHVIASNHNDEQLGWNEQSLRYVDMSDKGEFYIPKAFRGQSKTNKQKGVEPLSPRDQLRMIHIYETQCKLSFRAYKDLIKAGVCREQARGVLAPAIYTTFVWTVSLQALLNFLYLRKGKGAQDEIVAYATAIEAMIKPIVPQTMEFWQKG